MRGIIERTDATTERRPCRSDAADGAAGSGATPSAGGLLPSPDATDETECLRYERDYWRGLFEQVVEDHPEFGWAIDSAGRTAYCNAGMEEMTDMNRAGVTFGPASVHCREKSVRLSS